MKKRICIARDKVYDEVSKITAYIGSRELSEDGGSMFPNVATTDFDSELLDSFWVSSANQVSRMLEQFTATFSYQIDLEVEFEFPENYRAENLKILENAILSFMSNSIVAQWLVVAKNQSATVYSEKANSEIANINTALYSRVAPVRTSPKTQSNE